MAKKHNFGQFLIFGGLLYRSPFPMRAKFGMLEHTQGLHLQAQISSECVHCVIVSASGGQKPQFSANFDIFGSSCTDSFYQWGPNLVSYSRRMHNYKPSPIQRHQNRFCTPTRSWRNRAHNLWRSKAWRTEKQTNKKTQRFWLARRRVKSEPHQTRHGDRGPRARSCASKTFGVWRIVSPLGGAENFGVTRPPQLKTPITP